MYRLSVDGIWLTDLPSELKDFEIEIDRAGGINDNEQILRQITELDYTFWGNSYNLLIEYYKDRCLELEVKVYFYDSLVFTGTLKPLIFKVNPHKRIITSKIYDSGYSALIREKGSNKILLDRCPNFVALFTTTAKARRLYSVLNVFQFLVSELSDGKLTVQSTYLSSVGVGIITGGSLGLGSEFNFKYLDRSRIPEVSFNEFYAEIRKKYRIYSWFEGNVLRIEHEKDSFKEAPLIIKPQAPITLEESINTDYLYSEIVIGSSDYKPEDTFFIQYPYQGLNTWQEETWNNCDCSLENTLNLVSEYIIDSNVVSEVLDGNFDSRFDRIFMIEYGFFGIVREIPYTDANGNSNVYYNHTLQNYEVLKRWFGGIPECVNRIFAEGICYAAENIENIIFQAEEQGANANAFLYGLPLQNRVCDNFAGDLTLSDFLFRTNNTTLPVNLVQLTNNKQVQTPGTGYVIKYAGTYTFKITLVLDNILNYNNNFGGTSRYDWWLFLFKFDSVDDALNSSTNLQPIQSQRIDLTAFQPRWNSERTYTMELTYTAVLNAGEFLVPTFQIVTNQVGSNFSLQDAVRLTYGRFTLESGELSQVFEVSNEDPFAYKLSFEDGFNYTDSQAILSNPLGFIEIENEKFWIKNIKGGIGKNGNFELIGKKSIIK